MNVYKYRSNEKRHLDTLMNNEIFAALPNKLNDLFEIKFNDQEIRNIAELSENINKYHLQANQKLEKIGIYSLSLNNLNITLWSLYANENKGFCIEYDLNLILSFLTPNTLVKHSNVIYQEIMPELTLNDLNEQDIILKKTILTKYIQWNIEEEYRLIFELSGEKKVHPQAIKAIYFGEKMAKKSSETNGKEISQECVMNSLKGRNIKYFQVASKKNEYKLDVIEIEDLYKDSQKIVFKKNEIDKKVIDSNSFVDMNITSEVLERVIDLLETYPSKVESLYARKDEKEETKIIAFLENYKVIKICAHSLKIIPENQ